MCRPALLLILLAAPIARGQGPFDDVLAKFWSPEKAVRHRAVDQFIQRYDAMKLADYPTPKERSALRQFASLRYTGKYFKEAVDAGEAKPAEVRARMLRFAKLAGSPDREISSGPAPGYWVCYLPGEEHLGRNALTYLVRRRPEVARALASDPATRYRRAIYSQLWPLGDPQDQKLALQMSQSPKPHLRVLGVQALGHYPTGSAQDRVLAATEDPNIWVRLAAARVLPVWYSDRAERALLRLLDDPSEPVWRVAGTSLRDYRSILIVNAYRQRLEGDEQSQTFAATELAFHPDPRMLKDLVRRVEAGDYRFLDALAVIDHPQARETLLYLSEDASEKTRTAVLQAMRLAKGAEIEARLIRGLKDSNPQIVSAALFAVTHMGIRSALPTLVTMRQYELADSWSLERAIRACLPLVDDRPLPMQR